MGLEARGQGLESLGNVEMSFQFLFCIPTPLPQPPERGVSRWAEGQGCSSENPKPQRASQPGKQNPPVSQELAQPQRKSSRIWFVFPLPLETMLGPVSSDLGGAGTRSEHSWLRPLLPPRFLFLQPSAFNWKTNLCGRWSKSQRLRTHGQSAPSSPPSGPRPASQS